jgi:hypothetical protein
MTPMVSIVHQVSVVHQSLPVRPAWQVTVAVTSDGITGSVVLAVGVWIKLRAISGVFNNRLGERGRCKRRNDQSRCANQGIFGHDDFPLCRKTMRVAESASATRFIRIKVGLECRLSALRAADQVFVFLTAFLAA